MTSDSVISRVFRGTNGAQETQGHAPARHPKTAALQIGIDFGGTKIEAAALGPGGAEILDRIRVANPGSYDSAIRAIRDLVVRVETGTGERGTVGVGMPGSISPATGAIRNSNAIWMNGRPFREDLSAALGREVRLSNDANCLALSEAIDGAGAGSKLLFAVILGTGCGGGLVFDGHLIEGANGLAGEWGHTPLPWPSVQENPGPECWCGKRGCLEVWISGSGFYRDYAETSRNLLSAEEIIGAARRGDPEASAAFTRFLDRLGRALAVLCDVVDPDTFVIGGGLSNVSEIYDQLPAIIRRYVFSDVWKGKIVPAKWGDSSGVRGAAMLWKL